MAHQQEQMVKILFLHQLHQQVVEVVVQDLLTLDKLVDLVVEEEVTAVQQDLEILLQQTRLKEIVVVLMKVVEVVLVELVVIDHQEVIQDQVELVVMVFLMILQVQLLMLVEVEEDLRHVLILEQIHLVPQVVEV